MMPSLPSSDRYDDRSVAFLNLQRDAENLNPALVAAILNGGSSSLNILESARRQNPFLQNSSLLTGVATRNHDLLALSLNSRPFRSDPYATMELSRAQQQLAIYPTFNPLNLSTITGGMDGRHGNILESHKVDVSRAVQREAILSEVFQRGREEAILSLLRTGAVRLPTAPALLTVPASDVSIGTAADLITTKNTNARALETLGNDTRRKANAPYFDASSLDDPDDIALSNRRTRGGVTEPFPEKLHRMLCDAVESGTTDIISFFPHGRAFGIHHPERFCREIMPKYFKQSRLSSFQRQLNLYGFTRISSGPDCGGYYHELFLKGRPALVIHMRRVGVTQGAVKVATRVPQTTVPLGATPDFYSMTPVKDSDSTKANIKSVGLMHT